MPNRLTKADIIEAIQKEDGYSRKQSSEVTEILLEIIKQTLESGEDVMPASANSKSKTNENAEAATRLRMRI